MIVYRHIRKDKNEPFYIGIGKKESRAYSKYGRNPIWYRIVKKTEYFVEILYTGLTKEEVCAKEIELIAIYGRINNVNGILINLTDGGEGVVGIVKRKKTDAEKKAQSEKMMGEKHWSYGVKRSEETKEKMRLVWSKRNLNKVLVIKTCHGLKGRKKSPAHIKASSEAKKKPVIQLNHYGEIQKKWDSAIDAEKNGGFAATHITACCMGKLGSHKKFLWKYA